MNPIRSLFSHEVGCEPYRKKKKKMWQIKAEEERLRAETGKREVEEETRGRVSRLRDRSAKKPGHDYGDQLAPLVND